MMMLVVVVLDPRYKLKFVKYSLGKIIPNDYAKVDEMSDHLYKVLKKLFNYYFVSACSSTSKNDAYDLRYFSVDNDGAKNDDLQNKEQLHKYYKVFDEENDQGMVDKNELEEYLEEQNVKRVEGESFDILAWWKEKSDKYKVLATMARDILAIPVSTVSSESTFSTSGRVLDQFRSRLGPKIVEALVCAQDWLRASEICIDIERVLEDVEKYEEELGDVGIRQVDDIMGNI